MPPVKSDGTDKKIRDFFKPLTVPKSAVPLYNVAPEEIVLAPAKASTTLAPSPDDSSPLSSALSVPSSSSIDFTPHATSLPLMQLDGVTGDITASSTPSSSQRRVISAVDLPSLKPRRSDDDLSKAINITKTFVSSFSSLTSVPLSTQSSSRRIIKNGMHAVTNSDSGSAESSSSSSSSEDELQDASTFIPRKRLKLNPGTEKVGGVDIASNATKISMRQSSRLSGGREQSNGLNTPQRETTPPRKVYKHSLLNIARQREQEEKSEVKIRNMEAEFNEKQRQREEEARRDDSNTRGKLAALADDSDESERMKLAMERILTKDSDDELFFFRGIRHDLESPVLLPELFGAPFQKLARYLQEEDWRMQACLAGFLAEVVATLGLPLPLKDWLSQKLLQESREDLCEAYVDILEAGRASDGPGSGQTPCFDDFYHVRRDSDTERAQPEPALRGSTSQPPRALKQVIRLLRHLAAQAGDHAIGLFALQLMHAAIDVTVQNDSSLQCLISESLEFLLASARDADRVRSDICTAFSNSKLSTRLKCRAIMILPGCSKRSHNLRRRLALELICAEHLPATAMSTMHVDVILSRLRSAPEFQVTESTDYIQLNSLISVLDIAIDAGFTEQAAQSCELPQAAPARKKVSFVEEPSTAASPAIVREAESAVNKQIDAFILQLTSMSSRIKDAGTAHLHRTEAKHAIERLAKRLEYGVRTKPRPRKKMFGGIMGEPQRTFLSSFMSRTEVKSAVTVGNEGHALSVLFAKSPTDEEADAAKGCAEDIVADED